MKRRLLNLLTLVSLLLCVAVVALWVRSFVAEDHVEFRVGGNSYQLRSVAGAIELDNRHVWEPAQREEEQRGMRQRLALERAIDLHRRLDALGAKESAAPLTPQEQAELQRLRKDAAEADVAVMALLSASTVPQLISFSVPHTVLIPVVAAPLLPILFRRLRAARRRRRGLCPSCGYDLRGSPSRCPECGYTPAKTTA